MNPRDRHVRHLRFVCRRAEHARRGQTLLEDAMQTASLDDDGRIFVIRSLGLGRLSLHASATEWSRRLEQRAREAKLHAVFAASPAASGADAVWFPNAVEIWVSLAVRVVCDLPCSEWFWPSAADGWNPRAEPASMLRLAFQRVIALGGLPASFLLGRRLAAQRMLVRLLRAISADDLRPWLGPTSRQEQQVHVEPVELPASGTKTETGPATPLWPPPWDVAALQYLREFPQRDERLLWLAATALSSASPLPPSMPEARQLAAQVLSTDSVSRDRSGEPGTRPRESAFECSTSSSEDPPNALRPASILQATEESAGRRTQFGGLLFLVPLFERLGLGTWPNASVAGWAGLSLILQHCRKKSDDDSEDPLVQLFTTTHYPESLSPSLARLVLRVHRLSRQIVGLGLKSLIRRPARVSATEMHLDLYFRSSDADVRIRRAALDINPGWVPWLGRIVSFHFTTED